VKPFAACLAVATARFLALVRSEGAFLPHPQSALMWGVVPGSLGGSAHGEPSLGFGSGSPSLTSISPHLADCSIKNRRCVALASGSPNFSAHSHPGFSVMHLPSLIGQFP
jgi:hypothetical protein